MNAERSNAPSTWPWCKSYPPDVDWNSPITPRPLFDLLDDTAARYPDTVAIDFFGRSWSYRDLAGLVANAACGLQQLGVRKGSKVGLYLPNCPYYLISYFAVLKAGGTVVNINPLDGTEQVHDRIEDAEADFLITVDADPLFARAQSLIGRSRLERTVVCAMADVLPFPRNILYRQLRARAPGTASNSWIGFKQLTANDRRYLPVEIDVHNDIAALQYTGGTTGVPKGAMLSHANLYTNAVQVARWFTAAQPGTERVLAVLPLSHAFGMTAIMNLGVALGAGLVLLPRFNAAQVLRTIARTRITLLVGVPALFDALIRSPHIGNLDLSSLKVCVSGGDVLPLEVQDRFEALTGCALTEGYGLTECSPVVSCNPFSGPRKRGSIGLPLPETIVNIVSQVDGHTLLPLGSPGEICVRGPQVMRGYWRHTEDTAAALQNGLLHTGDIGYLDCDGYLFFAERAKDVIVTSGYNVYPRYVEAVLLRHPGVAQAAVTGLVDPERGQVAIAYVVKAVGADPSEHELRRFLEDRLSRFEVPKRIEFRDSLPKSVIGKRLRRLLAPSDQRRE